MRTLRHPTTLILGLILAVLWVGCERSTPSPSQTAQAVPQAPSVTPAPHETTAAPPPVQAPDTTDQARAAAQIAEVPPPQQTVKAPPPKSADETLRTRERRLAEREAAVAARERALTAPEPEPAPTETAAEPEPEAPPAMAVEPPPIPEPPPVAVTVPAGTGFDVEFTKPLASNASSVGQTFRARVVADVTLSGNVVIPAGSEVLGEITAAQGAQGIGAKAKLGLKFTDLVLPSGSTVPIQASIVQEGQSKAGKDAAVIGGSTAGGAILGRILSSARNSGRSSIIGALIGAAAGTAIASRTAGQEVVIPEGSVMSLRLDGSVDIRAPSAPAVNH
jgi:hypothetical protein